MTDIEIARVTIETARKVGLRLLANNRTPAEYLYLRAGPRFHCHCVDGGQIMKPSCCLRLV